MSSMKPAVLAPGLLLAAPRLGDPNFERSVVLLGHHDENGALGWVLNGRPLVAVRELLKEADLVPAGVSLPETESFSHHARIGGPVMPGSAWVLFRRGEATQGYAGEHDLGGEYAVTAAREAVEAIARGEGPTEFRLYLGYAGWGPQQLEGEIRAGAWLPATLDPELLMATKSEELWEAAYRSAGASAIGFMAPTRGSA